jgi:alpha-tubulin suppressor-like RCC1 family protein
LMASCLFLAGGSIAPRVEAFQLPAPSYPSAISAGLDHACTLFNTGSVKCWGGNGAGQVGLSNFNLPSTNLPVSVQLKGPAKALSSGSGFSCALLASEEVQCWGANFFGQVGGSNNGAFPIGAPVPLAGPVIAIASGWSHTCAIVKMPASTGVQCWGNNNEWQLGNSMVADFTQVPQTVPNMTGATSIAAGEGHTCVTTVGGTNSGTKCWGQNIGGQLGRGTFTSKELPDSVVNHVAYSSLAAGRSSKSTCGIDGGDLYCWGANAQAELGFWLCWQRRNTHCGCFIKLGHCVPGPVVF